MTGTLFISDLHLEPSRPHVTRALGDFLQRNRHCDALYILGDLVDAWVGDDDDSEIALTLTTLLRGFAKPDNGGTSPALFIMQGNRDFLLGETFCAAVGATLLPDPTVIDLYGAPTLLLHGDSLCTADEQYQAFRRTVRDPAWQRELLAQPLAHRRQLAAQLRGMSEHANSNKAQDIMDVTPSEVDAVMARYGVQQMIHGHTHRPACHAAAQGQRWVLGDWDTKAWALHADEKQLELLNYNI